MLLRQHHADVFMPCKFIDQVRIVSRPAQEADISPARVQSRLLVLWGHLVQTNEHLRELCIEGGDQGSKWSEEHRSRRADVERADPTKADGTSLLDRLLRLGENGACMLQK